MKRLISITAIVLTALGMAMAQTTPPPAPAFPITPIPVAVAAFGEFNHLGSPRFTMGIAAIYPVSGSAGIYGTTIADILPKLTMDPATGRKFYSPSVSFRQGFHKDLFDIGHFSFLLGGDVGPSFASQTSGFNISLSSSFIATGIYQVTPAFSIIVPFRMLYINGIGWNPIAEAGVMINLKNLKGK